MLTAKYSYSPGFLELPFTIFTFTFHDICGRDLPVFFLHLSPLLFPKYFRDIPEVKGYNQPYNMNLPEKKSWFAAFTVRKEISCA
jgi:hypothetical protein